MSECSPKFIKCILRQVNISWIACIYSVSHTASVKMCLPHFQIAPLIATCCGSVFMWSQGVKRSDIHRRMLVQPELKSVAWEAVYDWIWMSGHCRFGSGRINLNWIDSNIRNSGRYCLSQCYDLGKWMGFCNYCMLYAKHSLCYDLGRSTVNSDDSIEEEIRHRITMGN
jgi:hypothetical protein